MEEDARAEWRPIDFRPDLEPGRYDAGSHGQIRCSQSYPAIGVKRGQVLGGNRDVHGYRRVHLRTTSGKPKTFQLSRLVLEAFAGPPPEDKPLCLHRNDVPDDNRIENLRWGSRRDNVEDALRNERLTIGERSPLAKLKADDVRAIRQQLNQGSKPAAIASRFGVAPSVIFAIRNGSRWRSVPMTTTEAT